MATSVVLAAGLGTRMRSSTAKVLHRIGGRPLLAWVLDALDDAGVASHVVVVGHQREEVEAVAAREGVAFAHQPEQHGTGHAVQCAVDHLPTGAEPVLVTVGDAPLVRSESYRALLEAHREAGAAATVLTMRPDDPTGYGRVVRGDDGHVLRIVEHRDTTPEERAVGEVNSGIYVYRADALRQALASLRADNDQGELYLTDTLGWLAGQGHALDGIQVADPDEVMGINDRRQLALAEAVVLDRHLQRLMVDGVTIVLPRATYVEPGVSVGRGAVLEPFCVLRGQTRVGEGARVGAGAILDDAHVEPGATVPAGSRIAGPGAAAGGP